MAFFKLAADGRLIFTEYAKKHAGKPVEEVARSDPGYVQFARKKWTIGLNPDLHQKLDDLMVANGVPFSSQRRKKSSPPKRS